MTSLDSTTGWPAPDDSPTGQLSLDTAGERGSLSIDDTVVEKVAAAAAGEIDGVGGAARRVLGVPTGSDDGDGRPWVSARVTGRTAALDVRLTVDTRPRSVPPPRPSGPTSATGSTPSPTSPSPASTSPSPPSPAPRPPLGG